MGDKSAMDAMTWALAIAVYVGAFVGIMAGLVG